MSVTSQFSDSNTHKCDWCGSPHMTDKCFRKDPCNVLRFPLPSWPGGIPPQSILVKYRKPHPRNPDWFLTHKTPTSPTPCSWCKSPSHNEEHCYSKDTTNITRHPMPHWKGITPAYILTKHCRNLTREEAHNSVTQSRMARQARTDQPTSPHQVYAPTTPVSSQTAAEMRAFSTLRTLADINNTYARASKADHQLNKRIHGPCTWCTTPGHTMERCYARDPENLIKHPHSQWINGEPSQNMIRRYCKKFTQEEAKNQHNRHARSAWTPTTIIPAVSPDHFHLDREQSSTSLTPSPKEDTVVNKPSSTSDWLSGIS
jgi:hypothetical protein